MTLDWLLVGVVAALLIVLMCALFIWKLARDQQRLVDTMQALEQQVQRINLASDQQSDAIHEIRSGAIGVASRVKSIDQQLVQLASQVDELENLDPQTRRYSQAARMVESGATVDELMIECELPRAEAELLLSLKR